MLKFGARFDRRRFLQIGGGLTAAGVLAACTKSTPSSSTSSSKSGSGSASPSKAAGGTNGTTLTVVATNVGTALDRDSSQGSSSGLAAVNVNVQDPLVGFKNLPSGNNLNQDLDGLPGTLQPRLAVSWEQMGAMTWRFHLRQGVTNAAGSKFTSADVVYTFARALSLSGQTTASWYVANTGGLFTTAAAAKTATAADKTLANQVVAVDDYTVDFNLAANTGLFPTILAVWNQYIFDSTVMKQHATASDPWSHDWCNAGNAVGFGPYSMQSLTPGSSATLVADPNYYLQKPQFTTINISAVSNASAQLAAIQSGSANFAEGLAAESLKTLETSSGVNVVGGYTNKIIELFLNYTYAPWNSPGNVALRQAVAYAIPYDQIINGIYPGFSKRAYSHVPSTFGGYVADKTYTTDLTKAKALMVTAGFPNGQGLTADMPGLSLYYATDQADLATLAVYVRSALASIGIPITLAPITTSVFSTRKLTKKDLPMALDPGDNPLISDALYMFETFYVPSTAGGLIDQANYNNSQVSSLTTSGFTQTGAARNTAAASVQKIMMQELPAVPLAEVEQTAVAKKGIVGYLPLSQTNVTEYQWLK